MNKKIILSLFIIGTILVISILAFINLKSQNTEALSDTGKTLYITSEYDTFKDISDIEVLKEDAHQIVIAKVNNIDGCTNYNQKSGNYTRINTLGDIKILQVLKGDLEINSVVPFIRGGGTISYSDYQKSLSSREKKMFNENEKNIKYVNEKAKGDIEIEEGKTYLMFLYYDSYNERYEIMAYQYGLREYDINTQTALNNDTNQEEKLSDLGL